MDNIMIKVEKISQPENHRFWFHVAVSIEDDTLKDRHEANCLIDAVASTLIEIREDMFPLTKTEQN
jgi:hypothetical protein